MESEKDPENMTNEYYSRHNIKPSYQLINFHRLQPSTRVIHCLIYSAGKLRIQTLQSQMLSTVYGKVVQVYFHVKPQFLGTEGMESIWKRILSRLSKLNIRKLCRVFIVGVVPLQRFCQIFREMSSSLWMEKNGNINGRYLAINSQQRYWEISALLR